MGRMIVPNAATPLIMVNMTNPISK